MRSHFASAGRTISVCVVIVSGALFLVAVMQGQAPGKTPAKTAGKSSPAKVQPIGLEELKAMIPGQPLDNVVDAVNRRGIRFAPTDGVKVAVETLVRGFHPHELEGGKLLTLLRLFEKKEPTELIVGVAPFYSPSEDERLFQTGVRDRLRQIKEPRELVEFQPIILQESVVDEDSAYRWGNEHGVHVVIWAERDKEKGSIRPGIRVVYSHRGIRIDPEEVRGRVYRLEQVEATRMTFPEFAAIQTSNLIPLLISLSYYRGRDYRRAAEILDSIPDPDVETLTYRGNCGLLLRDVASAKKAFQKAVDLSPKSVLALHGLGTAHLLAAQLMGAEEEQCATSKTELATAEFHSASEFFTRALAIDPRSERTLDNQGIVLALLERWDESLKYFEQARQVDPQNPKPWFNYAAALNNSGKVADGLKMLFEYLKAYPEDHPAWYGASRILVVDFRKCDDAMLPHLRAIEGDSSNREYWDGLSVSLGCADNYYDEGTVDLNRELLGLLGRSQLPADERDDFRKDLQARLVLSYVHAGEFQNARNAFFPLARGTRRSCEVWQQSRSGSGTETDCCCSNTRAGACQGVLPGDVSTVLPGLRPVRSRDSPRTPL